MNIIEEIKNDIEATRRSRDDTNKLNFLTTLLGEMNRVGKDNGNRQPTEAECVAIVKKFEAGIRSSVELLQGKTGREEIVQKLMTELDILTKYIPVMLTEDQLSRAIIEIVGKLEIKNMKALGSVMTKLAEKYPKKNYDGALAAKIARTHLC